MVGPEVEVGAGKREVTNTTKGKAVVPTIKEKGVGIAVKTAKNC